MIGIRAALLKCLLVLVVFEGKCAIGLLKLDAINGWW
jgi:hypothetical protein